MNEIQEQNFIDGTMEIQNLLNSMNINQFTESQPDPDLFQDDNDIKKTTRKNQRKSKLYSNTKVKAKYFLTNIAYRRYKPADFDKNSFVLDIFLFLLQNLNPTQLDRKLNSETSKSYVKMLWENAYYQNFLSLVI